MEIREETLRKRKELADGIDRVGGDAYKVVDYDTAKKCYLEAFRIRFALRWETGDAEIKHDLATSFRNMSVLVEEEGDTDRAAKLKQRAWLLLLEAGKEKAMEQHGSVCVLIEKGIEANKLVKYIRQVSAAAEKPAVLLMDDTSPMDDNDCICGIALDKNNIGVEKLLKDTAHIIDLEVIDEFCIFNLYKEYAEKIKAEVLARASEL